MYKLSEKGKSKGLSSVSLDQRSTLPLIEQEKMKSCVVLYEPLLSPKQKL